MKTSLKVIAAVFALGAVLFAGLHLFLQFGLSRAMQDLVLPRIKQETGIDIRVEGLSINMVRGRLHLKGVAVRNPEGFLLENAASVERIEVELDIASLLRRNPVRVKSIAVQDALVNVIRNEDGMVNLDQLLAGMPEPSEAPREKSPGDEEPAKEAKPLPEVLVERLLFRSRVRYVDFRLNKLDIALDLELEGADLGTLRDPSAEWGTLALTGSLGDDRTSFITDLDLKLAPVLDPATPSFDLTGKIMEIDPRLMKEIYDRLGLRSEPFAFEPRLHCRNGVFEKSRFELRLQNIELEDKLADDLGGMTRIGLLKFPVPVRGTLRNPRFDVQESLARALGDNAGTVLEALVKGAAAKEAGLDKPPETLGEAAVEVLGKHVKEVGESETAKKVLKDLAEGRPSDTNAPSQSATDVLVDILGEEVDEVGESEELKQDLKNLGRALFGK